LKSCRVLVTPTSYGKTEARLHSELEELVGEVVYNTTGRPLTSNEVAALLPGCDGYVAGLDVIDRPALQAADRLKVIARYGVGVDNVDLAFAAAKGIVVTNTPGANSVSVAELTIALMLALARRIPEAFTATRKGGWPRLSGLTLEGKSIGVLGLGAIGKQVTRRLEAFDCRILAYDPFPDMVYLEEHPVKLVPLDDLLSQADFISLHMPLLPETRTMVNASFFSKIKPGAYLINTSRGELIDEAALVAAIQTGRLRGAALDVFTYEPPGADNPLLSLPQVIVTPHCASHTDGATNAMGWIALRDCLAVLRGEVPKYPVT
jgi:D-3-phosphoglycerate dehydrogenase